MLPWVLGPRITGGQKITYGRSLERNRKHYGQARAGGSAPAVTEWATLAQDRARRRNFMTERPFGPGKKQVRPLRFDTRVSPENTRRFMEVNTVEFFKLHKNDNNKKYSTKRSKFHIEGSARLSAASKPAKWPTAT
jgi:hypothetical protein